MNSQRDYNAKILEIEDNINQIDTTGIPTTDLLEQLAKIKQETEQEIKKCYEKYKTNTSITFLEETQLSIYNTALKKLNILNIHIIKDYQDYYKLYKQYQELSEQTKSGNISNLEEFVTEVNFLLQEFKNTSPIDNVVQKSLEDKIYELIYKAMKIELAYTSKSFLISQVKKDLSDISFIASLIKKEIQMLKNKKEAKELMEKVGQAEKQGFEDIYFINEDLILLIILLGNDKTLAKTLENNLQTQIESYFSTKEELEALKQKRKDKEERLIELKKEKKELLLKRITKKALLLLNLGILGTALIGSLKLSKMITTKKVYKTTTINYDSSLEVQEEPIIEFLPKRGNTVSLVEYSPWEKPGYFREEYQRNVYVYNLDALNTTFENVEDYLDPELKGNITLKETNTQTSLEDPQEDYTENKYIIRQTLQDQSVYELIENSTACGLLTITFFSLCLEVDVKIYLRGQEERNEEKRRLKKTKENLKAAKQSLLETKEYTSELTGNLQNKKETIEKEYDHLSPVLKNKKKIKKKILKIQREED